MSDKRMISINATVKAIYPILADKPPEVQSAALADLVAMWAAGYIVRGDVRATARARKEMLDDFCQLVRKLIPVNAKAIHGENGSGTVA